MDPFQKYKSASAVSSNQPVKQLLFVFDELIKLMYIAQKALGERDHETKFKALTKIEDTVLLLRTGISAEDEEDSSLKTLDNFYESVIYNLNQAHVSAEEPEDLNDLIKAMSVVRDSLKGEMEEMQQPTTTGSTPSRSV